MIILNDSSSVSNLAASSSAFDEWTPLQYKPQITSIVIITIVLAIILIYYNIAMRKLDPKQPPKGFAFFIFVIIGYFRMLVFDILGKDFQKVTPYILTLISYIFFCNIIGVIGFDNPTDLTTVTFSLGLATTLGTIIVGIKYQKLSFFYRFLFKFYITSKKTGERVMIPYFVNPFGLVDLITPLISISLRLWANITAGVLIVSLVYAISMVIFGRDATKLSAGPEVILFSFFAIPFHGFFDWLVGLIQAYVFMMLTVSYWTCATESESEGNKKVKKKLGENAIIELQERLEKENKINVNLTNVATIN